MGGLPYLGLKGRHSDLHNSAQEMQRVLAAFNGVGDKLSWADLQQHLGPELSIRVISQLRGVIVHLDRDEKRYEKAYKQLNAVLVAMFGKEVNVPKLTPPKEYQYENLPALPASLQDYLKTVPPSLD